MSEDLLRGTLLPYAVVLPLVGAFLTLVLGAFRPGVGRMVAPLFLALTALAAGELLRAGPGGALWAGGWNPLAAAGPGEVAPVFVRIGGVALLADGLGVLTLVVVSTVGLLAGIYASGAAAGESSPDRFLALLLLAVAGMNGCATSGDLFNMIVFVEMAWLACCGMVALGADGGALEGAFKALVTGAVGTVLLLLAAALVYGSFGTTDLARLAGLLRAGGGLTYSPAMLLATTLLVAGLGIKAGLVPFHAWLPDALTPARAPVAALLSGAGLLALGTVALARLLFQVLEAWNSPVLVWTVLALGGLSLAVGALLAVGQWEMRRLLAFHSVSQSGLACLGLGLALLAVGPERGLREGLRRAEGELVVAREELSSRRADLNAASYAVESEAAGRGRARELLPEGLRERLGRGEVAELRAGLAGEVRRMDARAQACTRRLDEVSDRLNRLRLVAALALLGAIFHLVCHALGKGLLALCAGSFERAAGTTELRELGGLWGRMPATAGSCALGALSLAGTPPLAGFWGPLMILAAAALSGHWVLAALIAGAGLANAVAMIRVQKYALFGPMSARVLRGAREVRADMWAPAVVLAALCLALGLVALWAVPWLAGPAAQSLLAGTEGWAALLGTGPGP